MPHTGLSSQSNATRFPVNLLMSGPAGGVTGALWISEKIGYKNLLTLDMGGTSADVALIEGGVPKRRYASHSNACESSSQDQEIMHSFLLMRMANLTLT